MNSTEYSGIPDVRMGEDSAGRGCRKKRMPLCNGGDRAANCRDTQSERMLTSETGLNEKDVLKGLNQRRS